MFRVSSILRNTRLDKDLSIDEVSKRLRIPLKYIEAFETENIETFPSEPYCSLIIKDYAQLLGLNSDNILRLFRRDYMEKRQSKKPSRRFLSFTPQFTFTTFLVLAIISFFLYLFYEYFKFNQPPMLKVNWPSENSISGSIIDVSGLTDPEATIRLNQDLVIVSLSGTFQKKINRQPSGTKITVEAKSQNGKTTVDEKTYK